MRSGTAWRLDTVNAPNDPPDAGSASAPLSAPAEMRFCPRCAHPLETREVAGKPRRYCPGCRYIHFVEPKVGVGAVLIEAASLLLVRRAMAPGKGKWCIPAGYLDRGEDPRETAVREVYEETSLRLELTGLVDVFHSAAGEGASIFVLYRGKRTGGSLRAGDDALEAGFFTLDALPEIVFDSTRAAVRELEAVSGSAPP